MAKEMTKLIMRAKKQDSEVLMSVQLRLNPSNKQSSEFQFSLTSDYPGSLQGERISSCEV